MRWALVTHPEHLSPKGRLFMVPKEIDESCIPAALAQGWIVLARDSDFLSEPDVNVQSNPRRIVDHGEQ